MLKVEVIVVSVSKADNLFLTSFDETAREQTAIGHTKNPYPLSYYTITSLLSRQTIRLQ